MERAPRVMALLAVALLALSACGEEAGRGHEEPTPHGAGSTAVEVGAGPHRTP